MPSEVMESWGISASSPLSEDICFPAERQVGFWKPRILSDHSAEGDGVAQIPGSKLVTSSFLGKLLPIGSNSVDYLEGPDSYLARDQKEKLQINEEEGTANLPGTPWRTGDDNLKTCSNLYMQHASSYVEIKKSSALHESSLFSSSFSDIFNRKSRVSTILSHQSTGTISPHSEEENLFKSLEEIEVQTLGNLLPDEDELFSGVADDMGYNAHAKHDNDLEDFDLFSSGGGMELEADNHLCLNQRHSDLNGGIPNSQGHFNGSLVSEHPYGEHCSRTLFMQNIDNNIGGQRIKLEPSHPGGAKQRVMQPCSSELGQDESILCQSANNNLSSRCIAAVSPGMKTSSYVDNASIQDLHSSFQKPINSFVENATSHGSSSVPSTLPSPMRVQSISNGFGLGQICHSLGQMKFGSPSIPSYHSHSFPECHDNFANAISYNSSRTNEDITDHIGLRITEAIDNSHIHRVVSNGSLIEINGGEKNPVALGSSGNECCPVHGLHHAWGNTSSYPHHHSSPMIWPNSQSFGNGIHAQRSTQILGFPIPSHLLNIVPPVHHHFVGSAPAVNPSLWNRRQAYCGDSPKTSGFHLGSLGSAGFPGSSPLHPLEMASHIFPHVGGNCIDISANVRLHSPQQVCNVFPGMSPMLSIPSSFDLPLERVRNLSHRRIETNSSHTDRKQYELDIDRILRGQDSRTTLMIKNIPNKYTSKMLLAAIDELHRGTYDFIYLPIDFKNKCNVGYAFVNMIDPLHIVPFHQAFSGKKWEKFNSEKVASLAYARIQGKAALIAHFQNSSLMNEDKRCRPILFHTDGPNAGDQEPFPMGSNIRSRPGKARSGGSEERVHEVSPTNGANGEGSSNVAKDLD